MITLAQLAIELPDVPRDGLKIVRTRHEAVCLLEDGSTRASVARHVGASSGQLSVWHMAFLRRGLRGLVPVLYAQPSITLGRHGKPPTEGELVKRIEKLAIDLNVGATKISSVLASNGVRISRVTVQHYLKSAGLGTKAARTKACKRKNRRK